jgi:gluconate kinase
MNKLTTYEEIRNAFVEGEITKSQFEQLAEPFTGGEMLKVEVKHHLFSEFVRGAWRALSCPRC